MDNPRAYTRVFLIAKGENRKPTTDVSKPRVTQLDCPNDPVTQFPRIYVAQNTVEAVAAESARKPAIPRIRGGGNRSGCKAHHLHAKPQNTRSKGAESGTEYASNHVLGMNYPPFRPQQHCAYGTQRAGSLGSTLGVKASSCFSTAFFSSCRFSSSVRVSGISATATKSRTVNTTAQTSTTVCA